MFVCIIIFYSLQYVLFVMVARYYAHVMLDCTSQILDASPPASYLGCVQNTIASNVL